MKYTNILKGTNTLKRVRQEIYGPAKSCELTSKKFKLKQKKDHIYELRLPSFLKARSWYANWQGAKVKFKGPFKHINSNNKAVVVEKDKGGYCIVRYSWLTTIVVSVAKTVCMCTTDTLWARGCQCGAING